MSYPTIFILLLVCFGTVDCQYQSDSSEYQQDVVENQQDTTVDPNYWEITCSSDPMMYSVRLTIDKTKRIVDWDLHAMFKVHGNESIDVRYSNVLLNDKRPFETLGVPNGANLNCELIGQSLEMLEYCPELLKHDALQIGWLQSHDPLELQGVFVTENHVYVKHKEDQEINNLRTWALPEHLKGKAVKVCVPREWQYAYVYAA